MATLTLAAVVGVLFATGTYLILRRSPIKLILGLGLLSHGVNILLFSTGGLRRGAPPIQDKKEFGKALDQYGIAAIEGFVDPLPQALILTAIVISFGVTAFTVVLVSRRHTLAEHTYPDMPGVPSRQAIDPFVENESELWHGLNDQPDDYEYLEYSLRDDVRWQEAQEKFAQQQNAAADEASDIDDNDCSDDDSGNDGSSNDDNGNPPSSTDQQEIAS